MATPHFPCAICVDESVQPVSTPCGHVYCRACILAWISASTVAHRQPTCPTCARNIDVAPENIVVNTQIQRAIEEMAEVRARVPTSPAAVSTTTHTEPTFTLDAAEITLAERIGSGAAAVVHRGTWQGTPVALKLLHVTLPPGSPEAARLTREVRLLSVLRHPHIVTLYGVARRPADGALIIVSKLGRHSLWDAMRGGDGGSSPAPLSARATLRAGLGVARALVFLHGRTPPVVHCDVKSANVIIDASDGSALLADFGVSRELSSMGGPTTAGGGGGGARGTSGWRAPENFDDESPDYAKPPSDVYSLGILLNEMLAGACPFAGRGDAQIMNAVLSRGQRPAQGVCAGLSGLGTLITEAWAHEPAARPTAAEVVQRLLLLQAELGEVEAGGPVGEPSGGGRVRDVGSAGVFAEEVPLPSAPPLTTAASSLVRAPVKTPHSSGPPSIGQLQVLPVPAISSVTFAAAITSGGSSSSNVRPSTSSSFATPPMALAASVEALRKSYDDSPIRSLVACSTLQGHLSHTANITALVNAGCVAALARTLKKNLIFDAGYMRKDAIVVSTCASLESIARSSPSGDSIICDSIYSSGAVSAAYEALYSRVFAATTVPDSGPVVAVLRLLSALARACLGGNRLECLEFLGGQHVLGRGGIVRGVDIVGRTAQAYNAPDVVALSRQLLSALDRRCIDYDPQ